MIDNVLKPIEVRQILLDLRDQIFTIAKKFGDNPEYRLSSGERRVVAQVIPEFSLNININYQYTTLKALSVLEILTQPLTLRAIEQGRPFSEVWSIAVREFADGYAKQLLERLELEDATPPQPRLTPKPISPPASEIKS